ncbi:GntR family transcriptional regulator [Streptomyces sp. NRRL S-1813]|uniref:GntR family transcriptional regulator n=1 Tax=Streptomyces sp. NRRL S-1813 TaxID=1463888 RepID=UPI0004C66D6C|nr:GntR family transcriptional regulator [Streptomyces sp. NRRL S-1813]
MASYRDVAAKIRRDVDAGLWPVGKPIPGIERLAKLYEVARETAHRAVKHLVAEGLLYSEGRRGTFIRPPAPAPIVARDRHAYRDELGYFFDRGAQNWRGVGTPTQEVGVPPDDVADLLGVAHGAHVMIRDRAVGPPDAEHPLQLATSYLPMSLVGQLPVLGAAKTGPGGIYDRIEEHLDAAIEWEETVSSRPANDAEQQQLRIGAGLPVLVVTRVSRVGDMVVEVNCTRMPADRFAVSYEVQRDDTARWPREAERSE